MAQNQNSDDQGQGGLIAGRPTLPVIGGLVAVVVVGIVLVVVAMGGGGKSQPSGDLAGLAADDVVPTPVATLDLNRPTAVPNVNPNLNAVGNSDRMIIPKIGVTAPLSYKPVGLDGEPPVPDGADDIAYHDFTAWPGLGGAPGKGGNAIFSGHVDSGRSACKNGSVPPPCTAVLWDLKQIVPGDQIEVQISGVSYKYTVTAAESVNAKTAAWEQIYATTKETTLTIITCAGNFSGGEYDKRFIVTAKLI
ncbi:MAG TPA: class F sortase [Dehalococcoidia bacterium]|nr:class F sortase [Dehalococcoidia bacterium]